MALHAYPLPVVGGKMSALVLRNKVFEDLGHVLEVRLVLLELHPVDQRRQLLHFLLGTLVVASQVLWQLLHRRPKTYIGELLT